MRLSIRNLELNVGAFHLGPLSLELEAGESLCIAGPSGCGKTSLLRAVAGFQNIERGEIEFGARVFEAPGVHLAPEKRELGFFFQNLSLWPHLSTRDHLEFVLQYLSSERKSQAFDVSQMLTQLQLFERAENKPATLSGGEAQRLALARALMSNPSLLLLDEPFAQLDPLLHQELETVVEKFHKQGSKTILHVTHNPLELALKKGRIALMRQGQIEQLGSLEQLITEPKNDFVREFFRPITTLAKRLQGLRFEEGKK